MKKLVILLMGLCLIGCSRANYNPEQQETKVEKEELKNTTTVCTRDADTVTFYATGDKILKEERHMIVDLSGELTENANQDELLARVNDDLVKVYGNIKGVKFETYWEENLVHVVLTVNYKIADIEELEKAELIDELEDDANVVSLEKSLLSHQKAGYACSVAE
ncbi:MAG: DUF1307 domain-containing protein [Firmicutes bacterium]|nr:DUF1307 domain-containing protein [Bacillota bacterium]